MQDRGEEFEYDFTVLFSEYLPKCKWLMKKTQGNVKWLADRFESKDDRCLLNQYRDFIAGRKRFQGAKEDPPEEAPRSTYPCGYCIFTFSDEAQVTEHRYNMHGAGKEAFAARHKRALEGVLACTKNHACDLDPGHLGVCRDGRGFPIDGKIHMACDQEYCAFEIGHDGECKNEHGFHDGPKSRKSNATPQHPHSRSLVPHHRNRRWWRHLLHRAHHRDRNPQVTNLKDAKVRYYTQG